MPLPRVESSLTSKSEPVVVIKIGTSSLIRQEANSLNFTSLASIVETVRDLKGQGYQVVLVSSGAVGAGCQRLGIDQRPDDFSKRQELSAVGQVHLMRFYEDLFSACGLTCAQVLLTLDNFADRGQYLNAANTFHELLEYGVIPVVNENDTVAVEQLRIGDNDTLSAQVATLVHADWLFLLTDVDALYTANPSVDPNAKPIREVPDLWNLTVDTSSSGSQWGTGGMATKLTAARMATAGGCNMAICHFAEPRNVLRILEGEPVGTVFHAASAPVHGRRKWILSVPTKGGLFLDDGAVLAVRDRRCSLFSGGIVKVEGEFIPQDCVRLCDADGVEFGRGLSNYSSEDIDQTKGMSSKVFVRHFGSKKKSREEIVHRAFICMVGGDDDDATSDGALSPAGLSRSVTPGLPHPSSSSNIGSELAAQLELLAALNGGEDPTLPLGNLAPVVE